MTEQFTDDLETLTNEAYMKIYSSPTHHVPRLAARLTQESLGTGYGPHATPTGDTARHAAERARRGLTYPESWKEAGLSYRGHKLG